jgi:hypothetical protein
MHVTPLMPFNPAVRGDDASMVLARAIFGPRASIFTPEPSTPGGAIDGAGTAGFLAKWSDADTLTDSIIEDDGDQIIIESVTNPQFTVRGTSAGTQVVIDGDAATVRDIIFSTGGSARWIFRANATAEGGSDVGSDLEITARDDSGALLSKPLSIERSTGDFLVTGAEYVFTATTYTMRSDSADASDDSKLSFCGGGAESTARGALALLHGNEHGSAPGRLHLFAGSAGHVRIRGDMFFDTDNTYDIGADGATRPRHIYLGGGIVSYPAAGSLSIQQSGTGTRWLFNASGHFVANNDNVVDIGAAGATRPRDVYLAGEVLSQGSSSKSADQATFANAQTNISSLSFAIGANEVWLVEAALMLTMVGATGVKFYFTGPAGVGGQVQMVGTGAALTTVETVYTAAVTVPGTFLHRVAGSGHVTVRARITTGGTGGTIQLVGITGAAGTTCLVRAGAWMNAERLS